EHGPQLLAREDPDVADEIRRVLSAEGIDVLVGTDVVHVEGRSGEGVRLRVRTSEGERTLAGSDILAATGRTPNTAGIGLDVAGVEQDARGYIKVNDRLETSAPDIWAIGEGAGSPHVQARRLRDWPAPRVQRGGGHSRRPGPALPLLPLPRAAAGAGRPERTGGPATGDCGARGERPDERRAADVDDG